MDGVMEFYTNDDDVWVQGDEGMTRLEEGSPLVGLCLEKIDGLYPKADEALKECYSKSASNVPYYNYLRARRFCKCNFGHLDHTKEDIEGAAFNFERVSCPLRGECKYEGVICLPERETRLSDAEKRVMRLVCIGRSNTEIAEELYLSPNTVKRHISTSYIKAGVRNRAEFIKYANDNSVFL